MQRTCEYVFIGAINISQLWGVHLHPLTDASQALLSGGLQAVPVYPGTHSAPERLSDNVGEHQRRGSGLQHHTFSELDAGVVVSVQELICLLHQVEHVNARVPRTRPLCASIVSSSFRTADAFSRPIARFSLLFATCSSSLDGRREAEIFVVFRQLAAPGVHDPRLECPHTFLLDFLFP
jgi:hypothetical protein